MYDTGRNRERERARTNDEPTKPNPHEDEMHEHRRIGTEKRHQKYRREDLEIEMIRCDPGSKR